MTRMKGNRGRDDSRLPSFYVNPFDPIDTGRPLRRRDRRRRILLPLGLTAVIAAFAIALTAFFIDRDDADAPGEKPTAVVVIAPSPASPPASATAAAATPTPSPALSPSATATATPSPAPTPTVTPTPGGPPTQRVRYIVKPGDACDLIRQQFRFAPADFLDFITALGRLSGKTPANTCVINAGNVLCVPAVQDLGNLDALTRDDACLAGQ